METFFDKELQKYGGTLAFMSNLNKEDTTNLLNVSNCFISEILSIWSEVNFEDRITSENQFHDQCLWYNSFFRIKNRPVFYKDWFNKGIRKVKDLKDSHNNFLSLTEFRASTTSLLAPLSFMDSSLQSNPSGANVRAFVIKIPNMKVC